MTGPLAEEFGCTAPALADLDDAAAQRLLALARAAADREEDEAARAADRALGLVPRPLRRAVMKALG